MERSLVRRFRAQVSGPGALLFRRVAVVLLDAHAAARNPYVLQRLQNRGGVGVDEAAVRCGNVVARIVGEQVRESDHVAAHGVDAVGLERPMN